MVNGYEEKDCENNFTVGYPWHCSDTVSKLKVQYTDGFACRFNL